MHFLRLIESQMSFYSDQVLIKTHNSIIWETTFIFRDILNHFSWLFFHPWYLFRDEKPKYLYFSSRSHMWWIKKIFLPNRASPELKLKKQFREKLPIDWQKVWKVNNCAVMIPNGRQINYLPFLRHIKLK